MKVSSCATCAFFDPGPKSDLRLYESKCRRFPPQYGQYYRDHGSVGYWCSFPPVSEDDWCGEWKESREPSR